MELPQHEERDEQMVRPVEALKVRAPALLDGEEGHDAEEGEHDPAGEEGAGREVGLEREEERSRRCRRELGAEPPRVEEAEGGSEGQRDDTFRRDEEGRTGRSCCQGSKSVKVA